MRRTSVLRSVFAILAAGLWVAILAKDFWQEKPFTQWSESEALMLVSNSPWAKTLNVPGDYGGAFVPRFVSGGPGASQAPNLSTTQGHGGENSTQLDIRWYSSAKTQQAIARLSLLRKLSSEEAVQRFIEQSMPDLLLAISGPVMEPFEKKSLQDLKPVTFLLSKNDKNKKIELKDYQSPKQTQDGSALYIFPRLLNDAPCMDLADDEAIFVSELGKLKIRAVFKPARMVVNGKLDM
jgi:hypothetical protein